MATHTKDGARLEVHRALSGLATRRAGLDAEELRLLPPPEPE